MYARLLCAAGVRSARSAGEDTEGRAVPQACRARPSVKQAPRDGRGRPDVRQGRMSAEELNSWASREFSAGEASADIAGDQGVRGAVAGGRWQQQPRRRGRANIGASGAGLVRRMSPPAASSGRCRAPPHGRHSGSATSAAVTVVSQPGSSLVAPMASSPLRHRGAGRRAPAAHAVRERNSAYPLRHPASTTCLDGPVRAAGRPGNATSPSRWAARVLPGR